MGLGTESNLFKQFPLAAIPADGKSLAAVAREMYDQADKAVSTSTATLLTDGTTIFTIANGPIAVLDLFGICITTNDATAATVKFVGDPTVGAAADLTAASASTASLAAGGLIIAAGTSLATAATVIATGVGLGMIVSNAIIVNAGIIKITVATGPSTGTFKFYMRYRPGARGVVVTAAL